MTKELLDKIFQQAGISKPGIFQKIDIGFSNDVYSVDDTYILKIGRDVSKENEEDNLRDVYFCKLFEKSIPAPKILYADTSKKITDRYCFIYERIPGGNLYETWHLYSDEQRRNTIQQICTLLKKINTANYDEFVEKFKIDQDQSWQDRICSVIEERLQELENKKFLSTETIKKLGHFLEKQKHTLQEENMALVYWDAHFDNFIVQDDKIVGILDFERIEFASIDYLLILVRRMVNYPKKYASEKAEKFVKDGDYKYLLDWYQEFYPELFQFRDLKKRIDLYSIEHCLGDLLYFPDDEKLTTELLSYLG